MRVLAALLVATAALSFAGPATAKNGPTRISGPGIEAPIRIAFADELAFWAGLGPRPVEFAGVPEGPAYTVDSDYWGTIIPSTWAGQTPPTQGSQPDDLKALYFVDDGLVRLSRGSQLVWLRLDENRQILLRRYVELGRHGLLPTEPTIFDVLVAARRAGEDIGVEVAGQQLGVEVEALWRAIAERAPGRAQQVPQFTPRTAIDFRLTEGRAIRLWVVPSQGVLADISEVQQANNYAIPAPNVGLPDGLVAKLQGISSVPGNDGVTMVGVVAEGDDEQSLAAFAAVAAVAWLAVVAVLAAWWLRRGRRAQTGST